MSAMPTAAMKATTSVEMIFTVRSESGSGVPAGFAVFAGFGALAGLSSHGYGDLSLPGTRLSPLTASTSTSLSSTVPVSVHRRVDLSDRQEGGALLTVPFALGTATSAARPCNPTPPLIAG